MARTHPDCERKSASATAGGDAGLPGFVRRRGGMSAPLIMAAVASLAALGGIAALAVIRGRSDGAIYARRMIATMLFALAGILGFFAWSMASWSNPA